ncbi:MAG TPA: IgGFc-binding protein [Labilithrix sp.]|nr:IgGFc-binding protein [Labilithrix sp.]
MPSSSISTLVVAGSVITLSIAACGSSGRNAFENGPPPVDAGDAGNVGPLGEGDAERPPGETRDPSTCAEAASSKTYVGCDYWPTVTPNAVWSVFDFAVVVANTGADEADVTVTGPLGTNEQLAVPAGELRKIALPWVAELKGADADACSDSNAVYTSVIANQGAYHLVSSRPVIVYQFNALEYRGEGGATSGAPKDWSTCPGTAVACTKGSEPRHLGCFSFSNDASLLLPSTAMTNTYRVVGHNGSTAPAIAGGADVVPAILSITATQPNTQVDVLLSPTAKVLASSGGQPIAETNGGGTLTLTLENAGDVAELVTPNGEKFDFSGSLVRSNKPVQVLASIPCITIPTGMSACDHVEETVLPAETLGKRYIVAPPTGPVGAAVQHQVRFYGNEDGTTLTYLPYKPAKCPDTLAAGQVADCELVGSAFDVTGNHEFAVATYLLGALAYNSDRGDPSQTVHASVEQFRTKYVFLAPNDYPVLWADVVALEGSAIELDGAPIDAIWWKIGEGPYGVHRLDLTKSGKDGAHVLTANKPVGVQVIGFGDHTSFQYPAGLNLDLIAPPPK